jgi:hypothetical protein
LKFGEEALDRTYGELSLEDYIIYEILISWIPSNATGTETSQWLLMETCPMKVSNPASKQSREELIGSNP